MQRVGDVACAGDAFGATHRGYAKSARRAPGRHRRSETSPAVVQWTEVRDPATGASYWWNKATNQTTALGAACEGMDSWRSGDPVRTKDNPPHACFYTRSLRPLLPAA